MKITGDVRLNGHKYSRKALKAMSAYVMQDDLLHAELTCAETLYYAAQLRLPQDFDDEQRERRINECIALMAIGHCKDVIVGDTRKKGISGGERKRLCIAIELLSKPLLIFLDEPTSGLDSTTAFTVCHALKNLAETGQCTVVCTIHQPQQKIFNLFDNLILLKRGKVVYQGSCQKSLIFLESIGLPCPADVNPADFLLDAIAPTHTEQIDEAVSAHEKRAPPIDLSMGANKSYFDKQSRATWTHQFRVIFRRSAVQYYRRIDVLYLNFVSTAAIACFVGGGIWFQQGSTEVAAQYTLIPSLFFGCVTQGIFGSMQVVNTFPSERAIMLRERSAGAYYVSSYYMAKSVVDMLSQVWPPILFSLIAYFMLGYTLDGNKFFIYMAFMMLDSLAATSLATAGKTMPLLCSIFALPIHEYLCLSYSVVLVRVCGAVDSGAEFPVRGVPLVRRLLHFPAAAQVAPGLGIRRRAQLHQVRVCGRGAERAHRQDLRLHLRSGVPVPRRRVHHRRQGLQPVYVRLLRRHFGAVYLHRSVHRICRLEIHQGISANR